MRKCIYISMILVSAIAMAACKETESDSTIVEQNKKLKDDALERKSRARFDSVKVRDIEAELSQDLDEQKEDEK